MDNLQNTLANVSLYDVKHYVRKAQNAVLNFTDMEAKVREATNNEPWGTPTSVMQHIAEGTQNYDQFHEIMPFVYRRFTEKTPREWRQIYKSLTLLDYLLKNGSERVVDYARSHTGVIEMLKSFRYTDRYGEDKGASIRRRAADLLELLGNVDRLRAERKKSRQLNLKTGIASQGGGFGSGSGHVNSNLGRSRGYGRESISAANFNSPAGGAAGGFSSGYGEDDADEFEEYDAGPGTSSTAAVTETSAPPVPAKDEDDDFADFQSAPVTTAAPPTTTASILDLFSAPPPVSAPAMGSASPAPPMSGATLFSSVTATSSSAGTSLPLTSASVPSAVPSGVPSPTPAKNDVFGSLWETSKTVTPLPKQAPKPLIATQPAPPTSQTSRTPAQSQGSSQPQAEIDDLLAF